MADQPSGTTNPQPGAAPEATAGSVATTPALGDPSAMYRVKVDGREFTEPASKLIAAYQLQSAAERRFTEANRLLSDHKADIQLAQNLRQKFDTNPEGAILEMKKLAEDKLGRPIKLPGTHATQQGDLEVPIQGAEGEPSAHTTRLEGQLRELQAELRSMRTTNQVDAEERAINAEIANYPMWRNNDTDQGRAAMELAKLTLTAMRRANPDVPIPDLATQLHSRMLELVSQQVTQVRDTRQQRVETMPAAPTQGGTPSLTTTDTNGSKWGSKAALRDGSFQKRMGEFFAGLNQRR